MPAANPLTKTTAAGKKNYSCKHNSFDKCSSCDRCWEKRIYGLLLLLLRHMHIQLEAYEGWSFLVACRCADVQQGRFVCFVLFTFEALGTVLNATSVMFSLDFGNSSFNGRFAK
jgi:hypothetical protein